MDFTVLLSTPPLQPLRYDKMVRSPCSWALPLPQVSQALVKWSLLRSELKDRMLVHPSQWLLATPLLEAQGDLSKGSSSRGTGERLLVFQSVGDGSQGVQLVRGVQWGWDSLPTSSPPADCVLWVADRELRVLLTWGAWQGWLLHQYRHAGQHPQHCPSLVVFPPATPSSAAGFSLSTWDLTASCQAGFSSSPTPVSRCLNLIPSWP